MTFKLQNAKTGSDNAKGLAAQYLASKIPFITDPFQMAITTYALQKAGHRDKDNAYIRLKSMARKGRNAFEQHRPYIYIYMIQFTHVGTGKYIIMPFG